MFKPIGSLIKNLPARSRIPEAILAIEVRRVAYECLKRECGDLGKEILDSVKVSSFKGGTLTLKAPSLVCCELQMRCDGLRKEINKVLGRELVLRIRFRSRA